MAAQSAGEFRPHRSLLRGERAARAQVRGRSLEHIGASATTRVHLEHRRPPIVQARAPAAQRPPRAARQERGARESTPSRSVRSAPSSSRASIASGFLDVGTGAMSAASRSCSGVGSSGRRCLRGPRPAAAATAATPRGAARVLVGCGGSGGLGGAAPLPAGAASSGLSPGAAGVSTWWREARARSGGCVRCSRGCAPLTLREARSAGSHGRYHVQARSGRSSACPGGPGGRGGPDEEGGGVRARGRACEASGRTRCAPLTLRP